MPRCPGDRKSTRLNSSHLVISYAVFCLKKTKNETSDGQATRPPDRLPARRRGPTAPARTWTCRMTSPAQGVFHLFVFFFFFFFTARPPPPTPLLPLPALLRA